MSDRPSAQSRKTMAVAVSFLILFIVASAIVIAVNMIQNILR